MLPDLRPRIPASKNPATAGLIRHEIGNALGRLEADRPRLAAACHEGNLARLVSMVLHAIDRECVQRWGLWTLEERRQELRLRLIYRRLGITLVMTSRVGGAGIPGLLDRTRRCGQLLEIAAVHDLIENVVLHAERLVVFQGLEMSDLEPHAVAGFNYKAGYAPIDFFEE